MKVTLKKLFVSFLSLFILVGCTLPGLNTGNDESTITIAAGGTTEIQIMAGMVKGMIEYYTDKKVVIVNNLGTTTVIHQAMMNHDVSLSAVRYTGTDLMGTLQLPAEKNPEKAEKIVKEQFQKKFNQTWFPSYGFANSYAFMVSKETAKKYNLSKISDLVNVAKELEAGVDTSWMNRDGDGFQAFKETYGITFKKVYPMQIGLVYDAVHAGKMDVVLGYSTDGRIASYDLVTLEDDLHFFPPYDASVVVSNELLKEHPELEEILLKLRDKISTKTMQRLNYEADNNLIEPEIVGQRYLQEHHFFEQED